MQCLVFDISKGLLNIYYVTGSVLGAGGAMVKQPQSSPQRAVSYGEKGNKIKLLPLPYNGGQLWGRVGDRAQAPQLPCSVARGLCHFEQVTSPLCVSIFSTVSKDRTISL